MRKVIFVLLFFSLLFSFNLKYKKFVSEFNQSVKSENKIIYYQGEVFVNNDLIFWHYKKPIEKKIWVTRDNKIYVYEPDLEQVTIYKKSKKDNLFKLVKDAKLQENGLYLKEYDGKKIFFKTKNGMIKEIFYKDKVDNLVTLNFYNTREKKEFNSSLFIPQFPDEVDVIYAK